MRSQWCAAITAAVGLVVLTGPTALGADEPASVHMTGYRFEPASMTVAAGATVEWINDDVAGHDVSVVTGPATFASPNLAPGEIWNTTLTVPGVYEYICTIHPDMAASVTVTAAATTTTSTTAMSMSITSPFMTSPSTTSMSNVGAAAVAAPPSASGPPLAPLGRLTFACGAVIAASLLLLGKRRDET